MAFKKATKQNSQIKLAITGPSGSGKTYSALLLAKGLGGTTALLDTEFGSASLYSDIFDFDTWDDADPNGFPPEYFIRVIKAAEQAGYNNLIIHSLSHEWMGRGGCLEIADAIAKAKFKGNSYTAWSEVTPRHNKLIETIVGARINIIATMRSKAEYVLNKNEVTGKSTPQKVGMGSIQRDGMDYEFTTMFELDRDSHLASAGKDRTSLFHDPFIITEDTGKLIAAWLVAPKPKQKLDAFEYIKNDFIARTTGGESQEDVLDDYKAILGLESRKQIIELNEQERKALATAIYKRLQEVK